MTIKAVRWPAWRVVARDHNNKVLGSWRIIAPTSAFALVAVEKEVKQNWGYPDQVVRFDVKRATKDTLMVAIKESA